MFNKILNNKKLPLIATFISATFCFNGFSHADETEKLSYKFEHHGLSPPPSDCQDTRGKIVKFFGAPTRNLAKYEQFLAIGFMHPKTDEPVVVYDSKLFPLLPHAFQQAIYEHECSHHQLGHTLVKEQHITKTTSEKEDEADCHSLNRLINKMGYGEKEIKTIVETFSMISIVGTSGLAILKRQNHYDKCFQQTRIDQTITASIK